MNVQEFNWKEMVNNSKGKTSLMLVLALLFGCASVLGFVACGVVIILDAVNQSSVITDINTYSLQCVAMATLAGALLGARRFSPDKEVTEPTINKPTDEQ